MIRIRNIITLLVVIDILLLLVVRFLMQFASRSDFTLMYRDASGVSVIATASLALWYVANELSGRWFARGKICYLAITGLSSVMAGLLSFTLVLPAIAFSPILNMLTLVLLQFGIIVLPTLAVMLAVRRVLGGHGYADPVNDTTFYRDRSLLFVRNNKNTALCILKLVSQSAPCSGSNARNKILRGRQTEDSEATQDRFVTYSHLVSLWNNVPDFGVEFMVDNGLTSVKFFTSAIDSDAERATRSAEQKAEKLRSVLQARFHTKIGFLQGHALWLAYGSILGTDPCCSHETLADCVKVKGLGESEEHYVALSALKRKAEPTVVADTQQAQAEQFVSAFAKERLTASMVIRLEAINPPSVATETRLLEKARNQPDMRVLIELSEKKSEVNEERSAQLSGFWKVSAYVAYRGRNAEETKLFQEKGDACIEAIYSSARSRVRCERLKGKSVAAQLNNILFRRGMGIVMMKASSRLAATLLNLPEERMPGIPETAIPNFEVPPREELEDGEVTIGIVMSGDNEICPLRMKLDDLMLHTVIFGETGFGKTRLVMKLLEAVSHHDAAWTIIEMKGEYKALVKALKNVIYLRPASESAPLKICLFDPQMENPETHAKKIFTILKETFSTLFTDQNRDLSAQMERVFYEALVTYVKSTTEDGTTNGAHYEKRQSGAELHAKVDGPPRSWEGFNAWLRTYAERSGSSSMPQINSTIQALLNRLNSFTRTPLNEVFDNNVSNVNFNDLVKRRTIIDLSEVRTKGTAEDLRLISNIITKYVATAAQQREIQQELKHILVIDDALDIVPEILAKKTTAETTITEQMVLLLRTTGQGVIISTQRPNISQNIVANAATKIFLRTTVDNEKAAKWLNLDEEQADYLKAIPRREAVIMTPKYSKPIRIKTLEMDLPKVDNRDIIVNNMMNYPIIYDRETKIQKPNNGIKATPNKDAGLTQLAYLETVRLRNIAETPSSKGQEAAAFLRAKQVPKTEQHPDQATDRSSLDCEERRTYLKVKEAFKHQLEIVEEDTLQSRLKTHTPQELRTLVEPLIRENIIGEVKAPNYADSETTKRIYYQTTDHEARNILQEYITKIVHRDLQSKGINTRWIDQNLELLITNDNQHVITTWTNNSIDPTTTIAKLTKIRNELENEQTGELIIVTPWKKDATKLQNLITHLNLHGIVVTLFNEDEVNKLISHITIGALFHT